MINVLSKRLVTSISSYRKEKIKKVVAITTTLFISVTTLSNYSYAESDDKSNDKDILSKLLDIMLEGKNSPDGKEKSRFDTLSLLKTFLENNAGKAEAMSNDELAKYIYSIFKDSVPGHLGFGFVMGYCSGYSLKKISKIGAFLIGSGFMCVQFLSAKGYWIVNYKKIQDDLTNLLDVNKDGKLDQDDIKMVLDMLYPTMTSFGGPPTSFLVGLITGLRS